MHRLVFVLIAVGLLAGEGRAQPYPSRPITMVVPLPAGGAVDSLARILVEHMRVTLGQTIVVENMAGAGGTLAMARIVRSAPDGYTISMGSMSQYVISAAVYEVPFDVLKELEPVALLPIVPYWMIGRKALPANTMQELIVYARANPGKLSAASTGTASLSRFCGMAFEEKTGTSLQYVPYRGGAPALQDIVAGQIDLSCDHAANSLGQYRNGNVKAYAVMAKSRWFAAPEVPTSDEAGVPGLYISTWHGFWVAKGTPAEIVAKINSAAQAAMADATTRQRLADLGAELPPPELRTPAAFGAFHKAEVDKWFPIVKAAGIKAK